VAGAHVPLAEQALVSVLHPELTGAHVICSMAHDSGGRPGP
jgi:hypothetical protein